MGVLSQDPATVGTSLEDEMPCTWEPSCLLRPSQTSSLTAQPLRERFWPRWAEQLTSQQLPVIP